MLVAEHLGAGQQDGGALGGGQRTDVVGMQAGEVVDRARAVLERDGHRAHGRELLDVGAKVAAVLARQRADALRCFEVEGHRLDVDVERASRSCSAASGATASSHPSASKPLGTACASSAVERTVCGTASASRAASASARRSASTLSP